VTLRDAFGELRGCRGSIEVTRTLGEDVRANALATAFEDWRFAPLRADEWEGLQFEISLLGPLQLLPPCTELRAAAALRPGVDGVVLRWQGHQSTLLPQVWKQLPEPAQFLVALKVKAGLARAFWASDLQLLRFTVRKFNEASL
jgi:AmmeMemoRadiSam system protein A